MHGPNFVQNLEALEEEIVDDADVEIVWDPEESYSPAEMHGPRPDEYNLVMMNGVLTPIPKEDSDWVKEMSKLRPGVYSSEVLDEMFREYGRIFSDGRNPHRAYGPRGGNIYFDID